MMLVEEVTLSREDSGPRGRNASRVELPPPRASEAPRGVLTRSGLVIMMTGAVGIGLTCISSKGVHAAMGAPPMWVRKIVAASILVYVLFVVVGVLLAIVGAVRSVNR